MKLLSQHEGLKRGHKTLSTMVFRLLFHSALASPLTDALKSITLQKGSMLSPKNFNFHKRTEQGFIERGSV